MYNSVMFKSYWYVCTSCDASIEIVSKGIHFQDPSCNCSDPNVVWCQTNVVESDPTNERNEMETTSTAPYSYDANTLVTYKSIDNKGEVTYPTLKVNELEMHLDSYRRLQDQLAISNGQISKILDNLSADGWYNPNYDKSEVLNDLCEILGHEPKQTVTITATVNVEVSYDIPLEEVEDFDARYFLQDNLTIDSWHGDVSIESFDVEDADVSY
jgi:predicted RNA-binding Zn-ribbon protein involved in translation (DUF1610 family)